MPTGTSCSLASSTYARTLASGRPMGTLAPPLNSVVTSRPARRIERPFLGLHCLYLPATQKAYSINSSCFTMQDNWSVPIVQVLP